MLDIQDQSISVRPNWEDKDLRIVVTGMEWMAHLIWEGEELIGYGHTPTQAVDSLMERIFNHFAYLQSR